MKIDPFGQASMQRPQLLHIAFFIRIVPFNDGSPTLYDVPWRIMNQVNCQIPYTINLPEKSKFHEPIKVRKKIDFLSLKTKMESVRKYACGRYLAEGEPFHFSGSPFSLVCDLCCLPFWMQPPDSLCCEFSLHPNRYGLFAMPQERRLLKILNSFREFTRKIVS